MNKIVLLDEQLTNLIAAGEVVDRPSAIVKELIENAIDAKARQITIAIKNGGLDEIAVYDDGEGMSKADLQLAFLAHSTSKIAKANDLQHLTSLGFRGEALAAIGAVSCCTILTNNGEQGYFLENKFGTIGKVQAQAANQGTRVTVKELFYQSPARLKFLKSVDYETALISDLVQKFSLSYLKISFQYYHNERLIFNSPGNNQLGELLFNIYGASIYSHLLPLQAEDYDFSLSGYISDSHYSRSNKFGINIFINERLVAPNNLTKAILAAYQDYLAKGKYPLVVLKIKMDPQLTDVNVSPTKWQVRIAKEKELLKLITTGIINTLRQQSSAQLTGVFPQQMANSYEEVKAEISEFTEDRLIYQQLQLEESPVLREGEAVIVHQPSVIGQAFGKYIIASFRDELWLIDQHAAQERCNYEKFRLALQQTKHPQQVINLPPLEVSMAHIDQLSGINEKLAPLGLNFEAYGPKALLLRSIPLWISQVDIEAFVYDLLDYCLQSEEVNIADLHKTTLASLACHSSVKFNEFLDLNQQVSLVKELLSCENPYHCPHGRPTIIKLTDQQLSKEFERG